MVSNELYYQSIIAELIKVNKNLDRLYEMFLAQTVLHIEEIGLFRKLNYSSAAEEFISDEVLKKELDIVKHKVKIFSDDTEKAIRRKLLEDKSGKDE
jgi:hypothetical protein